MNIIEILFQIVLILIQIYFYAWIAYIVISLLPVGMTIVVLSILLKGCVK